MNNELILGTECKVRITLPRVSGISPYGYDFNVELYVNPKKRLTITREECVPSDEGEGEYLVPFDSSLVGIGDMTVEIVAYIPDEFFADGLRTERIRLESVATIIP